MPLAERRHSYSAVPRLACLALLVGLWAGVSIPRAVAAQTSAGTDARAVGPAQEASDPLAERGSWWTLWSRRTDYDRAIVGLTTIHVYKVHEGFTNNWGFGLVYDGWLGATFITTHGPRGWVAAVERSWLEGNVGPARTMLGFRTGLVYGYDHRLGKLAARVPVLPYAQPVFLMRAGPVNMDVTYTWVVASLTLAVSL